jgi:4-aminobutyrate aminotransferase-like enzyme
MSNYVFDRKPKIVPLVDTNFRKIATTIPASGTESIMDKLDKLESRSMHGQLPLVWHTANDFSITDHLGNRWIDFTSTIFVANVGHSNPHVIERVQECLSSSIIACYAYPNEIRARYLEKLLNFAGHGFEKAFLLSAGTEATEAAFKLMKMHGQKIGKNNGLVIGISGNWHGRTMGAQLLSDNKNQKEWIEDKNFPTKHLRFPYPWLVNEENALEFLEDSIKELENSGLSIQDNVCGIMLETFQGWGAFFYPKAYVQAIRAICDKYQILLCFDEMQSGFGRTGKNFGYEHYEVEADLLCIGKGMGGGFPISGVLGKAGIMDLPDIGNMSSTHSGNPTMCAAALGVIEEIDAKNLVQKSQSTGILLHTNLRKLQLEFPALISGIYGKGMIASIVFAHNGDNSEISTFVSRLSERIMQKGVLVVHTGRESIKIGPPLTIPDDALLEGISVIREAIFELLK